MAEKGGDGSAGQGASEFAPVGAGAAAPKAKKVNANENGDTPAVLGNMTRQARIKRWVDSRVTGVLETSLTKLRQNMGPCIVLTGGFTFLVGACSLLPVYVRL